MKFENLKPLVKLDGTHAEEELFNSKISSIKSQICRSSDEVRSNTEKSCLNQIGPERSNSRVHGDIQCNVLTSNESKVRSHGAHTLTKAVETCRNITRQPGVHSVNSLEAAGFRYTYVGDAARCNDCQLEVTRWTSDMDPFSVHAQRSPNCTFVKSVKPLTGDFFLSPSHISTTNSIDLPTIDASDNDEPSKRQKLEVTNESIQTPLFIEVEMMKQLRRQTFSHWPHRTSPSQTQMIQAGFFNCNVGDRVICIYCNLICQQWTPHTDDPCEVHKILSPKCPFVVSMLVRREATPVSIINLSSVTNGTSAGAGVPDAFRSHEMVLAAACNSYYIEIPKRHQSFTTWPNELLPSVDDLVRAGFFYTGNGTIVTCFYCNGSLQNWGANDNPTIEHARWFPHCGYAKQLCGDDLYRKIQESKRNAQERAKPNEPTNNVTSNAQKLIISDESTLSRFVAARLDLPVSQKLLNQNFKLSIIKRCWEDQLRLKSNDFATDCDLLIACTVLQKQINFINGKKENIIVPSIKMRQLREAFLSAPAILIQYPNDFSDQILKTAANFAYPCQIPSDDQSEYFTFVVLDSTSLIFRFGYCRRSNRESTCLCILSYYPWFEIFCNILNDLSQIINTQSVAEVEAFLSSLYNYKLMSIEEFYKNGAKEIIEITNLSKIHSYPRPDQRKLPSISSNSNFTIMFSRLGPDTILRLFAHLIFERRILFISSKLSHLTACTCGCLYLINPMHWQSIFLPILPESMTWTAQCTAPYIIGIHSSIYSRMNKKELGDVVIVNIDDRRIESQYDDVNLFPKHLIRNMKKDIQQSSQFIEDHLARIFLRAMAFIFGNYASGFVIINEQLDFDRNVYLRQYLKSDLYTFMSSVVNTQIFEQFSRHRTYLQRHPDIDIDEFDIEVKNFEQSKQLKTTTNPLIEQIQTIAAKLQPVINKPEERVTNESSSVKAHFMSFDINNTIQRKTDDIVETNHQTVQQSNPSNYSSDKSPSLFHYSTPKFYQDKTNQLIDFNIDENPLLPRPMELNINKTPETPRSTTLQINSKIKQLQNELQYKVQTFNNKPIDPHHEYNEEQKEINKLIEQFDPLNNSNNVNQIKSMTFHSDMNRSDRHPSISETIPTNYVNNMLKNIQSNYEINTQLNSKPNNPAQQNSYSSSETNGSNLIDFD
ncbi:unnamed protein product [Rotaria sp. Silwood2]|nr:unnamed protein product [Rotaria sp. Silwood2]